MKPLNKKYFGNRNIGVHGNEITGNLSNSQNYADDRIGGEGIASVNFDDLGLNIGAYLERIPTVSFSTPDIPGGVRATGTVAQVQAVKALINNRGSGYQINDIIEVQGGTGTKARFKVTKLKVLDVTISDQPASSNFDGGENLVWDSGVDDNWTSPTILRGIVSTGPTNYDLGSGPHPYNQGTSTYGVWDGYADPQNPALAPSSLTITGGDNSHPAHPTWNTRGANDTNGTGGTGPDNNGYGGTANFTYGIHEVVLVSGFEGDYTAVPSVASASVKISGSGNDAATFDVFYGVKAITITERGSGYTSPADAQPTFSVAVDGAELQAVGAAVLTTDSGIVGSAYNQENAIIIHANTDDLGAKVGDIIKQSNARSYKVKTADGIAVCKLVASDTPAFGEAYIIATDNADSTYWVTKLQGHRCTLVRRTDGGEGYDFANGSAPWKLFEHSIAQPGYVKIENA